MMQCSLKISSGKGLQPHCEVNQVDIQVDISAKNDVSLKRIASIYIYTAVNADCASCRHREKTVNKMMRDTAAPSSFAGAFVSSRLNAPTPLFDTVYWHRFRWKPAVVQTALIYTYKYITCT